MQHSRVRAMRILSAICVVVSVAILLGTAARARAQTSASRARHLIYVSDPFAPSGKGPGVVYVFAQRGVNPQPIGQIRAGINLPYGLAVDAKGILYVANSGDDTVKAYAPGRQQPIRTFRIPQPFTGVDSVAVGPDGTVYASGNGSEGFIVEFLKGSSKAGITINMSTTALAVDSGNNLFAITASRPGHVYVFPPGSVSGTDLGLTIGLSYGIAIDALHDVVVSDLDTNAIEIFPPGSQAPQRTITQAISNPRGIAFNASGDRLYASTAYGQYFGNRVVVGFDYPRDRLVSAFFFGGPVVVTQYPIDIALSPAPAF